MSRLKTSMERLAERYPLKRVAITGAGSGLGRDLARLFAEAGWTLWLNDIDEPRLSRIASECEDCGASISAHRFDVSDLEAFLKATSAFEADHGGVDIVFTSAGIGVGGTFLETESVHIREVIEVNLLGTMWAGRAFLPSMAKARRGHFVTIASAAAFHGLPHLAAYAATKAGVVQFSETIRSELAPFNVDVTTKMTTLYTSDIAEFTRGSEAEREKARSLVAMAPWSSQELAESLVDHVARRHFYMVAPGQSRFLWRFKRVLPERYLRLMPRIFPKIEAKLLAKAAERKMDAI